MAETYTVVLSTTGPWVGCESEDEYPLSEFGFTDEDWDELSENEQRRLLNEWAEDNFWNRGYEYHGGVSK